MVSLTDYWVWGGSQHSLHASSLLHSVPTSIDRKTSRARGARPDRTLYADPPPPPPPPPWKLAGKCQTMGAKGALRKFCLN